MCAPTDEPPWFAYYAFEPHPMWRSPSELGCELNKTDVVLPLESTFTDKMLFLVVIRAEADHPTV
jgi:hypothetical protein